MIPHASASDWRRQSPNMLPDRSICAGFPREGSARFRRVGRSLIDVALVGRLNRCKAPRCSLRNGRHGQLPGCGPVHDVFGRVPACVRLTPLPERAVDMAERVSDPLCDAGWPALILPRVTGSDW
jgi:hypothetical protein